MRRSGWMHLPWRRRLVFYLTTLAVVPAVLAPLVLFAIGLAGGIPPAEVARRMAFAAAGMYLTVLGLVGMMEMGRAMMRGRRAS